MRLDRVIRGIGRVHKSLGTSDRDEFGRREAIILKLRDRGALDILRAWVADQVSIGELVEADRLERLYLVLADQRVRRSLKDAVTRWLPTSAEAPASRGRYATSWRRFWRLSGLRSTATVEVLATFDWAALKARWGASGSDWNKMRAMLSAFLTAYCGHVHAPFRLAVMGRLPRAEEGAEKDPQMAPAELWSLVKHVPKDRESVYVAMAALGTGPAEIRRLTADDLVPARCQAWVTGTKTGRKGKRLVTVAEWLWPYVEACVRAPRGYKWLRLHFNRARVKIGRPDLTMYALRHLFGQLAVEHGAPLSSVRDAMGHQDVQMTTRYTRRQGSELVARAVGEGLSPTSSPGPRFQRKAK